jgi:predicted permease
MQAEEYVRGGMSPEEARRQAVLAFGGVEGRREECRDARGTRVVEELVSDVRYASRSLRRSPVFALAAVLTLALGIGANSALFELLNGLVHRMPPGVSDTDRLVWVDADSKIEEASYADYRDLVATATPAFRGVAAYTSTSLALGAEGEPAKVSGQLVSGNYFTVLSASPVLGRGFSPEEGRVPGADPVVVIGHELWEERFAGDRRVVGRAVVLNGHTFTVIGVAPPGFTGVDIEEPADLWVLATMQQVAMPRGKLDVLGNRKLPIFRLVGRLHDGVTPEQADRAIGVAAKRVDLLDPDRRHPFQLKTTPLHGWIPAAQLKGMRSLIAFAWLVTGLVLAVACANVANLLLARVVARRREIGIRLTLGVGRGRLLRFLLTEALILSLTGGALGLLLSVWVASWFRLRIPGPWGRLDVSPDARTILFTLALAAATGVLFGLVPAWRAGRPEVVAALKGDDPAWLRRTRVQSVLVVVQLALSLVLLLSAALFLRRLQATQRVDVGFDTENVLTLSFDLSSLSYSPPARAAFLTDLRARIERLPGVRSVSVPAFVPMASSAMLFSASTSGGDGSPAAGRECALAAMMGAGAANFRTLGIDILRGREMDERELASSAGTVIVSESLAAQCWPGEDAVGKLIRFDGFGEAPLEVLGVARDISFGSAGEPELPQVYVPSTRALSTVSSAEVHLLVRTAGDPAPVLPMVRAEFHRMDPRLPLFDVRTLAQVVDGKLGFQRRLTGVVAGFGALALLLAALGLYGVVAFTVAGRTREIGVRMALGARPGQVVGGFVRDGFRLALVGCAAGGVLSLASGRLIGAFAPGIRPADPVAFAAVGCVLGLVTLLATYLPARAASRVDPMEALRAD